MKPKFSRPIQITLFDSIVIWIICISLTSITLLTINNFNPIYSLIISTIIFLKVYQIFHKEIHFSPIKINILLTIILLVALFFRVKPYLYIMGAQDEGIYVNMSSYYTKYGTTFIKDKIREKLDKVDKQTYDLSNQQIIKEDVHVLGIDIYDYNKSEYIFRFYPLHPLWMSIFSTILGTNNRVYSLVFFSILSIVSMYFLTYQISGNRIAAYITAWFLAINPLHTFFSKFPTTEILTLFFSSTGLYYLIKLIKQKSNTNKIKNIFLSCGIFWCLFFNHISGFFYIPLLLLLLLLSHFEKDTYTKNKIIRFSYLTLIGFLLSIIYGYIYSPHYFTYIYKFIFEKLPNVNLIKHTLVIGSIVLIPVFTIKNIKNKIIQYSQVLKSLIPHIAIIIIFIASYKTYIASFTSTYINKNPGLIRWNMFNHGFESIRFSSLFVYISYITPLGLIILIYYLYQSNKQKKYYSLFIEIILILFLFTRLVIGFTTPYQYYYARYLLSEIVPYSLLLISLFLGKLIKNNTHKTISIALTLLISLNFLYHTSFQLQGQEADGSAKALEKVSSYIDEQDLLIIDSTLNLPKIITPLKYFFNINSLILDINKSENHRLLNTLFGQYNDIFIISAKNSYNTNRLIDTIEYKEGTYEHSKYIPKKFSYESIITFFLYKLHPDDKIQLTNTIDPLNKQLYTKGFYKNSKWTNGNSTISNICYYTNEKNYLIFETNYTNPNETDVEKLNLEILINDYPISLTKKENNLYYFSLDENIEEISKIQINSSTFTPYEMNINPDTRKLGLYINSIKFL